jgi:cobyrinic acid a,c-diamide synthase
MKLALRDHVRSGGRLYAEGGGLAYLCQHLHTPDQGGFRMVGVFPAIAHFDPTADEPEPTTLFLNRPTWLAQQGTLLRGYRNPNWRLEPVGSLCDCAGSAHGGHNVVCGTRTVGSCVHFNFAVQHDILPAFFQKPVYSLGFADPWPPVA